MGMPQIMIEFRTAGETAVFRSARGQVVLLVPGESRQSVSFSRWEQVKEAVTGEEAAMLRLCFLGGPRKVWLERCPAGEEREALESVLHKAEGGWLCAPRMEAGQVVRFVREAREQGSPVRCVVSTEGSPDCSGAVNFVSGPITVRLDGEDAVMTAGDYCPRIAGILAGISLRESATYYSLPEVVDFPAREDPEGDVDAGRLILDRGAEGVRLGRAVTSLVSGSSGADRQMRKIKLVEGMDLIRWDIRSVFEREYVGKVLNDYDSKLLLVTAVNRYFAALAGSVLDTGRKNRAYIDLDAQKQWLEDNGISTEEMSETAILSANTGSLVFLKANVRFADAMEDLTFRITM